MKKEKLIIKNELKTIRIEKELKFITSISYNILFFFVNVN